MAREEPTETRPREVGVNRTTRELAQFAVGTRFEDLPTSTVVATKRVILDAIAVTIGAWDTKLAAPLLKLKADCGGVGEATLMVDGRRLPVANVAYVHAQLSNALDADETLHNRSHVASAQVFAALAIAEKTAATGRDLIAAVAIGHDVSVRIGHSLKQYVPDASGTLVFAPVIGFSWMSFGTAAVTARLLGLDAATTARAFGQALVMTPVAYDVGKSNAPNFVRGRASNWHKYQMSGPSAEAGINAALLVADGWIAQDDIFDAGSEFWRSFGALGCDYDFMYSDLGRRWFIAETSFKIYPFCRYGAGPIDLFGKIVAEHKLSEEDIESVLVRVAPLELTLQLAGNGEVDEDLKTIFDLPMALGRVLAGVPPGPAWFDPSPRDPRIPSLARKVKSEVAPEWGGLLAEQMAPNGVFRRLPAEVVVRTRRGDFRDHAEYTTGDPWDPAYAMSDAMLAEKVRSYAGGQLSPAGVAALIDIVSNLEEAPDVSGVVSAMTQRA